MNTILVTSHRRSGTHFLIDSLRKNISDAEFPNHRHLPADFNLGSLFSKSDKVYSVFTDLIDTNHPVIIRSHLLPEECHLTAPKDKYEELVNDIFTNSKKLYISRGGKDVLISLYKYLKPESSFSAFLREENDHIVKEIRSPQAFDANRVAYWSYHINQWQQQNAVNLITFDELMTSFKPTMTDILNFLQCAVPADIVQPMIPNNMLWHNLQKKLNHFGLVKLPESSSVRPNKRSNTADKPSFSVADDEFFSKYAKAII